MLAKVKPLDEEREAVVGAISPLLFDRSSFTQKAAFAALANWQPRMAATRLAGMLDSFFDHQNATKLLIKIGPPAEDAVLKYLAHPNAETRHNACFVLSQIGTEKSLGELRKLRRDRAMGRSAQEAYDWIRQRIESTKNPFLVEGETESPGQGATNPFVPKD